jgi:hypothetical protein
MSIDNDSSGFCIVSKLLEMVPNDNSVDKTYHYAMKMLRDKLVPIDHPDTGLPDKEKAAVEEEKAFSNILIYRSLIEYTENHVARLLKEYAELDVLCCKAFNKGDNTRTILESELSKKKAIIDEYKRIVQLFVLKRKWYEATTEYYSRVQQAFE